MCFCEGGGKACLMGALEYRPCVAQEVAGIPGFLPQGYWSFQVESVSALCLLAVLRPLACHTSPVPSHLSLCLPFSDAPQGPSGRQKALVYRACP